jgi:hypothetical protein
VFLSQDGIYAAQQGQLNIAAFDAIPFSDLIQKTVADIDKTKLAELNMSIYKEWLIVTYVSITSGEYEHIVLDTTTNTFETQAFGWTQFKQLKATSFNVYQDNLYYGCSSNHNVYQFYASGQLFGDKIYSYFMTKRYNHNAPGVEKHYKAIMLKGRAIGDVYITPYIDGVPKNTIHYALDNEDDTQEIYFPRENHSFNYIGKEIQLKVEVYGDRENTILYPPRIGARLMNIKEGGKRQH